MCNPMIMMAGMAALQMGQSVISTNAQNEQAEASAAAANRAASYDYQQLAEQKGEVDQQAAQEKLQRQLQTAREHGRIAVAQGEAGVGGNSSLRVLNNALMQGSFDIGVIEANRGSKTRQIMAEVDSVHAKNVSRVNQAESNTVSSGMGFLNAGLAGVSGAATGYTMGQSMFGGKTMSLDDNAGLGKAWKNTDF